MPLKVTLFHSVGSQEGIKADMYFQSVSSSTQSLSTYLLIAHLPSLECKLRGGKNCTFWPLRYPQLLEECLAHTSA